ncbi:MAG: von Willebrand factor type A domain-containing protein [Alphaproteobacteria bacterium]|nr:von Willebrand factor type A domain-containing protein [Alphaproteobacteria bacterium]
MKKVQIIMALCVAIFLSSCTGLSDNYSNFSGIDGNIVLGGDSYTVLEENPFVKVSEKPISTFSIDADGGSYSNVRRFIQQEGQLPPKGAVRTEELINYFNMDYPYTDNSDPINLNGEVSICPWNTSNKLIRIGIKGKPLPIQESPVSNFVFLIDVSGSMSSPDKLELLKQGFTYFVDQLSSNDKIAIVTYAGYNSLALGSTPGSEKTTIKNAIASLGAGGGTNGASGIITAYEIAQKNFIQGGNNRVILGTDGDFNIGLTSLDELVNLIKSKRDNGIFLTVLGVGRGNLNDATLEQIANNGNGTYEYLDKIDQLKKVFIYEKSKFFTVAKDVKIQVEFNKDVVESYRLIGYENRLLQTDDFTNDSTDAGEIGANQNITALYEIVPAVNADFKTLPTFNINARYKNPNSDISKPININIYDRGLGFHEASDFMKFAANIASFSMLITNSKYKASSNYDSILNSLNTIKLSDPYKFNLEFKEIVQKAKTLK